MLSVALKILSILGILLLCLLGLALLLALLVLFFPISYRLTGRKDMEEMSARVRISWLFGLLRVLFDYPEPGRILVRVLPFTVFDSGKASDGKPKETSDGSKGASGKGDSTEGAGQGESREGSKTESRAESREEGKTESGQENKEEKGSQADLGQERAVGQTQDPGESSAPSDAGKEQMTDTDKEQTAAQEKESEASQTETDSPEPLILKKFKKIKYTIRSIYDKIKNIWENISYYMELLREEETRLLFSHVLSRLGKILKSIRPRRIRGQILFGTGSPDTTGYAFGVYGMLSPFLGSRLLVTPDFTRAVLEGDIYIAGHITVFTIIWNGLKVLLDKKLRRFIQKMKAGRKK